MLALLFAAQIAVSQPPPAAKLDLRGNRGTNYAPLYARGNRTGLPAFPATVARVFNDTPSTTLGKRATTYAPLYARGNRTASLVAPFLPVNTFPLLLNASMARARPLVAPVDFTTPAFSSSHAPVATGTEVSYFDTSVLSANASVGVSGISAPVLDDLTGLDIASDAIAGTVSIALDDLADTTSGAVVLTGTSVPALDPVADIASATVAIVGTSTASLETLSDSGVAAATVTATCFETLDLSTVGGTGTTAGIGGGGPVTGDLGVALSNATEGSLGTVMVSGRTISAFGPATDAGSGTISLSGTTNDRLGDAISGGLGIVFWPGQLGADILSSSGTVSVSCVASRTLAPMSTTTATSLAIVGTSSETFTATFVTVGKTRVKSVCAETFTDVSTTISGLAVERGRLSQHFDAAGATVVGVVPVQCTTLSTLQDMRLVHVRTVVVTPRGRPIYTFEPRSLQPFAPPRDRNAGVVAPQRPEMIIL